MNNIKKNIVNILMVNQPEDYKNFIGTLHIL